MLRTYRFIIILFLLLCIGNRAYSQEGRTEIRAEFRVNSASFDRNYSNNANLLSEIISFLQKIEKDSTTTIEKVLFCASASPEGSFQLNHKLARARLETLERIVRNEVIIPENIISRDDSYISWELLQEKVTESDLPQKQAILDIIALEPHLENYPGGRHIDHRIVKLQKLDGGKVWRQLHSLYFERMRNACVIFITYKHEIITPIETIEPPMVDSIVKPEPQEALVVTEDWTRKLHVKTNAIGLGMGIANIAAEIDLAKHWSFALPVYYSAWNYFKETLKFRTFAIQPEVRYWPSQNNTGFFAGAHFGWGYYNFAFDGEYRYQDRNANTPAIGGGLSLGYRLPISKNRKWNMEFAVGAGVYSLHYDEFYNIKNGKLIDSYRETYCGIDNAAINISYSFDLKKRKK